jgi:hypothetical protein
MENIMASRDLNDLDPNIRTIVPAFLMKCKTAGLSIIIICTYRNNEEQAALYAHGRDADGNRIGAILTNCKPGQSEHNKIDQVGQPASRAFDVGVIRNGKYVGDGQDKDYLAAGEIGESLGLEWAGRWTGHMQETAHFQLKEVV